MSLGCINFLCIWYDNQGHVRNADKSTKWKNYTDSSGSVVSLFRTSLFSIIFLLFTINITVTTWRKGSTCIWTSPFPFFRNSLSEVIHNLLNSTPAAARPLIMHAARALHVQRRRTRNRKRQIPRNWRKSLYDYTHTQRVAWPNLALGETRSEEEEKEEAASRKWNQYRQVPNDDYGSC